MRIPAVLAVSTLVAVGTLCCAEEVATSQGAVASPPESGGLGPGDTMVPVDMGYVEVLTGGARPGDALPLLIALHGKLGAPELISRTLSGLRTPARIIAPRGARLGTGHVWWDLSIKDGDPRRFSAAAREAARRVDGFVRQIAQQKPTLGKPVVAGFSQGAVLTYSLLVRDPDLIAAAFPLSGSLPLGLEPAVWPAGLGKPPVHAFHGTADPIVPLALDVDSVTRLRALGVPVVLTEIPGMSHVMGPEELALVLPQIDRALQGAAAAAR